MQLNHIIVHCTSAQKSAAFLAELLGRPQPVRWGPFYVVETGNGVQLDFDDEIEHAIVPQHYAFLITEPEFDQVLARIQARQLRYLG
jgi:catechol 2,3-dioxygenase-like lactoylglutathione lyase family enzyme